MRTKSRTTNLSVVSRVNAISRAVTAGSLSMEQGFAQLEELSRTPPQPLWQGLLANGLSASFFALLFHGGGFDFAVALVCGLLTRLLGLLFSEDSVSSTLYALLSGALSAVVAVLSVRFFHMGNQTPIIIGAIMPLLPGRCSRPSPSPRAWARCWHCCTERSQTRERVRLIFYDTGTHFL